MHIKLRKDWGADKARRRHRRLLPLLALQLGFVILAVTSTCCGCAKIKVEASSKAAVAVTSSLTNIGKDKGAVDLAPAILSPFGAGLRLVLVVGITQGFCQEGTGDWRSTVPKYIAREIGRHGGRVLVWNANKAQHTEGRTMDCMFCIPDGKFRTDSFNCADWFEARRAADLVIVGGSGEYRCRTCAPGLLGTKYAQLKDAVSNDKPWMGKRTRTVHIPISRQEPVLANKVVGFDQLLLDEELVKPMHLSDAEEFLGECRRTTREKRLVYVARYHSWKGQLDFLRIVDPKLLSGYTIEFFSSKKSGEDTVAELNKVAKKKGISVVTHTKVLTRQELLHTMCGASGLVHFARTDANPRAVYEGLLAGLPAFITKESRVPSLLARQAFVQMVSNEVDAAGINTNFAHFMGMVNEREERQMDRRIKTFIKLNLIEARALRKICGQLGICEVHH